MASRAICVALLLWSLPIAGCGTVANLATPNPGGGSGKTPFGGVRQDMSCLQQAANGESAWGICHSSESERHPQVALMLLCSADLPFTLIGDVVTWPYTAAYTCINEPVPVPPLILAPPPPVPQVAAEKPRQTEPEDTLPEPRKLP